MFSIVPPPPTLPYINRRTVDIIDRAIQNSVIPYPIFSPLPVFPYGRPVINNMSSISSHGLNIDTSPFMPFSTSVYAPMNLHYFGNPFRRTCINKYCNRYTSIGNAYCCANCKLSEGIIHSTQCNTYNVPTDGDKNVSQPSTIVKINDPSAKYYKLNNFYLCHFTINGIIYKSAEHYYQSCKFIQGTQDWKDVATAVTGTDAHNLGNIKPATVVGWEQNKYQHMKDGLDAKFGQNSELKDILLSTGNAQIINDITTDEYWGTGTGSGENQLGKLLVQIRDNFR
jgi:N-glycosidase YbiA